jgi:tetratricopeptide (TPR) repeat protein
MRHRSSRVAWIFCLLLSTALAPAMAQDWAGRGRVRGTVKDEAGKPIEGAKVTLRFDRAPETGPEPIETSKEGIWGFMGLGSGAWRVLIEKEGYVPSEGVFEVSQVGAGARINVVLRPAVVEQVDTRGQEALAAIEAGNSLLTSGKPAEARAKYEEAISKLEPENHAPILQGIAGTYLAEKNPAQAVAVLEQALALDPPNVELKRELARALYEGGNRDRSIAMLEEIVTSTQDTPSLKLLIDLLVMAGREADAQKYMAQLPAGEKVSIETVLNAGIKFYNEGKLDQALTQFDRAVQENAEAPEPYYYRGLVHLAGGRNPLAAADLKKFLELAPQHDKAAEAREFLKFLE